MMSTPNSPCGNAHRPSSSGRYDGTVTWTLGIVTTANGQEQLTQPIEGRNRPNRTRLPSTASHYTASTSTAGARAIVASRLLGAIVFSPYFSSPRDRDPNGLSLGSPKPPPA
ncbi:MAG TPA: hypothetical protein VEL69_05245 [Ktedonobacteraceae bacterium]|nr:hypothetical protein [Ktedonobacteraceae bacterium]